MSNESKHRYLFTVRQGFGLDPCVDTFYELQVPTGITGDQAMVMSKLNPSFCKEEIAADTQALNGMQLRLRFNQDMFQRVCLVRTCTPISAELLDDIVANKHRDGRLVSFLEESAIK